MMYLLTVLVVTVAVAVAAPNTSYRLSPEDFPVTLDKDMKDQVVVPQKRAALVLDRLLVALQKALHEESEANRIESDYDGPRTAPLRYPSIETNDRSGLQRRGQGSGPRGRVLRCYFNAITCF